jgi:transposase
MHEATNRAKNESLQTSNDKTPPDIYTLQLQYAGGFAEDFSIRPHWNRTFEVSKDTTLESLSRIIVDILDWDPSHLYEFQIQDKKYVHFGEDDYFFLETSGDCVSCDIPLFVLKLANGDSFQYIYDFGDWHVFVIIVTATQMLKGSVKLPALVSYEGKNLLQYPGAFSKSDERRFQATTPSVGDDHQSDRKDKWRIRFVQLCDEKTLESWRKCKNKQLWDRAVTILENRNLSLQQISTKIERPVSVVQGWIKSFNSYGIDGIRPTRKKRAPDRRALASEVKKRRIIEILHDRPSSFGINRSNWNLASLASAFENRHGESISRSNVSRLIRSAGYGLKKAKKVLTSPDPDYREKVELVLGTLQNLQSGELFFFIDEMGPLRVIKYGGRMYSKRTETPSIPQVQSNKGSVTLSGALSATTNQVSWIFGRSKDTSAMIDLIELLFNQYNDAPAIYVTWDAASWHDSLNLNKWLDEFNSTTQRFGIGPTIFLIPLPTSSQFLDVIESIFSGMKRAVIHHSDYQSDIEMKEAISCHFRERNAYFKENPKRVGKKIWQQEFFSDFGSLPSGNYREW